MFFKAKECTKKTVKGPWVFMLFVARWLPLGTNTVLTLELFALSPYFRNTPKPWHLFLAFIAHLCVENGMYNSLGQDYCLKMTCK